MATRMKQKAAARNLSAESRPHATAKFVRISPFKVRVVLKNIIGKPVNEAVAILENTPKAASEVILKVVNSAAANGENNISKDRRNYSREDMYIAEAYANEGPTLKRIQAVSKGRAYRINKRTSHITVVLGVKNA